LINEVLDIVIDFAQSEEQILALALWINELAFDKIGEHIASFEDRTYGEVWSRHIFLDSQAEIELSFADKSWADIENLDRGTTKVVGDGFKILYDPQLVLEHLVKSIFPGLGE